ncbi:ATPase [Acidipropionibacterium acidipropionici ATCC 4875]|uniref:ATPase n=1 Tax=Acidipropionibacterium acidipropionici (strain ATCC 4875 / DSM 20272 / JCM 6432 / NBRC 12425 / NCIMB 8070 / 4) TaxID=1171373 RepID=K7S0H3_ACIA4|nr:helicase HerA-like domain-containing protein [Acidipropionibacterium acidipropionici]AFV90808.1 ATPase [Acidipropionibacterium acidipropionici ATCC 4875]ALN15045.1 ATPase [Acidipropionibacterium acidipropionici]APZ09204.1 ATP-binding protein [Acidipropionibacterium acidipropionici]
MSQTPRESEPVAEAVDDALIDAITTGYTFEEPALDLGALSTDAGAVPSARVRIPLSMVNRHGLVAGATGTGKTKTLQVMAEQLSAAGVPVFAADIKGDLSGLASAGEASDKLAARTAKLGQQWAATGYPVEFYALGGAGRGIPVRATVSSFGPVLLSKVLSLNDVQESSLGLVFHFADKAGLPLLDLKDLQAVLNHLGSEEGKADLKGIGGLSSATLGVIIRKIVTFADQGAAEFFGEPEFDTADLMRTAADGRGIISLLELPDLADRPALFSTFLMWLLADLFSDLPEVGDAERPKLVFFFDEAHLLFDDASKAFLDAIAQTVRLIRSKGVGVFFVTQTPKDVPDDVLAQLGSRVQHQLRAHTPNDAKALKQTVATFPKSSYDLAEVLQSLGIGEAIVTVMDPDGAPTPVARTKIFAPTSLMAPTPDAQIDAAVKGSSLYSKYAEAVDRDSAYEMLARKLADGAQRAAEEKRAAEQQAAQEQAAEQQARQAPRAEARPAGRGRQEKSVVDKVLGSSVVRQFARSAGREIVRSLFGTARRRS